MQVEAPNWFTKALNTPYTIKTIDVDGCAIEYLCWGDTRKPCLLFVHGNGGHANWWDFIAPHFIDDYCVCALHLSGMGNSGYRERYTFESYAKEIVSVAQDAGYSSDIIVVGHSLGGTLTIRAAQIYRSMIKAIIIIDSPMFPWQKDVDDNSGHEKKKTHTKSAGAAKSVTNSKAKSYYPNLEAALDRFRLIPKQPCNNHFILDHIARLSIREFEKGWGWKFDEGIHHNRPAAEHWLIQPTDLHCLFTYIYGEQSTMVPEHVRPELEKLLKNIGPVIGIPKGHHHLMLDEPEALIASLRCTLKSWRFYQ